MVPAIDERILAYPSVRDMTDPNWTPHPERLIDSPQVLAMRSGGFGARVGQMSPVIVDAFLKAKGPVLDVGCGKQLNTISVSGENVRITPVGHLSNAYGIDPTYVTVNPLPERIIAGVAEDMPFKDRQFDLVFSNHALGFYAGDVFDPYWACYEMIRVCKDGGRVLIEIGGGGVNSPDKNMAMLIKAIEKIKKSEIGSRIKHTSFVGNEEQVFEISLHGEPLEVRKVIPIPEKAEDSIKRIEINPIPYQTVITKVEDHKLVAYGVRKRTQLDKLNGQAHILEKLATFDDISTTPKDFEKKMIEEGWIDILPRIYSRIDKRALEVFKTLISQFNEKLNRANSLYKDDNKGVYQRVTTAIEAENLLKQYRKEAAVSSGLTGDHWYDDGKAANTDIFWRQDVKKYIDTKVQHYKLEAERDWLHNLDGTKRDNFGMIAV